MVLIRLLILTIRTSKSCRLLLRKITRLSSRAFILHSTYLPGNLIMQTTSIYNIKSLEFDKVITRPNSHETSNAYRTLHHPPSASTTLITPTPKTVRNSPIITPSSPTPYPRQPHLGTTHVLLLSGCKPRSRVVYIFTCTLRAMVFSCREKPPNGYSVGGYDRRGIRSTRADSTSVHKTAFFLPVGRSLKIPTTRSEIYQENPPHKALIQQLKPLSQSFQHFNPQ